jgi:hypothetical protein
MLAGPDFHPEFGFLCPSPRRRRGMRLAVLCIVSTMAIGATMGLAVARWPANADGQASTAEPANGQPLAQASAAGVDATPGHGCKADKVDAFMDLLALFLEPVCGSKKRHGRHRAHTANRVATVIIGHTAAVPAAPAPAAVAATDPSKVKVGYAEQSANVTTAAVERPKSPKKPRVEASAPIALAQPAGALSRQNAMLDAYAAARFGREAYDPYRNPYRATARRPGFDASFGRSW